jgi:hypothetical protein
MPKVSYVVTGYDQDTLTVKIMVGDKSTFTRFQWDGVVPLDAYLKSMANQVAWQLNKPRPINNLSAAVGKTADFDLEDPMKMPIPPPMQPRVNPEPPPPPPPMPKE